MKMNKTKHNKKRDHDFQVMFLKSGVLKKDGHHKLKYNKKPDRNKYPASNIKKVNKSIKKDNSTQKAPDRFLSP